jgi:hypothetical protein
MSQQSRDTIDFDYDVCLSFAGEDREYVEKVAAGLRSRGIRVFYDRYEQVELWGKDLYTHLDDVYQNSARYCVMFVSAYYAAKLWTNHERQSAQARAFRENVAYILPARFDNTEVPGLRDTVGYIDLRHTNPDEFIKLIQQKVGDRQRANYFPPVPDRLFEALGAEDEDEQAIICSHAHEFLRVLRRITSEERSVIFQFFLHGCWGELPENMHINVDLLRRSTDFAPRKLKRILSNLQSLGFFTSLRDDDETEGYLGHAQMFVLEWHHMTLDTGGNATNVASEMIFGATKNYCEEHGLQALERLDFSQLASATAEIDEH